MTNEHDEIRPAVDATMAYDEFARWYWPVEQLHEYCDLLQLSRSGTKAELRQRVMIALGQPSGGGLSNPNTCAANASGKTRPRSRFNWSRAELEPDMLITDNISFGPNVRNWFKQQIGASFVCHSDFMDWVKGNAGATLADAVEAWHMLERRKDDPSFRREIAICNNYLRYLRDIRDNNPALTHEQAMQCWHAKKLRPANDGIVEYEREDLRFID